MLKKCKKRIWTAPAVKGLSRSPHLQLYLHGAKLANSKFEIFFINLRFPFPDLQYKWAKWMTLILCNFEQTNFVFTLTRWLPCKQSGANIAVYIGGI